MTRTSIYLDSSALVKLVFEEVETDALERFLVGWPTRVSSVIARVEVLRAAASVDDAAVLADARLLINGIHSIGITEAVIQAAITAAPTTLRTLDAIHLGTALTLGSDLAGLVAYDVRLAQAARHAGLTVWSPS